LVAIEFFYLLEFSEIDSS